MSTSTSFSDWYRDGPFAGRPQAHRSVVPEAFRAIEAGPVHMINVSPPAGAVVDPAVPEYALHLVLSTPPLLRVGFNRPVRWLAMSPGVMLITPPDHPLAKKRDLRLEDLSPYGLILPPKRLVTYRLVDLVFQQARVPYTVALEVGGWEVIKRYVELGMGVSIVMSICIAGNENLEVIPVGEHFPKRTYGVVWRKNRRLSPQARGFIRVMDPELADELDRAGMPA